MRLLFVAVLSILLYSNALSNPASEGACCFEDGSCAVLDEFVCAENAGLFQGAGTTCDPNPCPEPIGACCNESSDCRIVLASECVDHGDIFYGAGTSCEPSPCLPAGACCFDDECEILQASHCSKEGGLYLGDGTSCDAGNPCVTPTEQHSWGRIKGTYR